MHIAVIYESLFGNSRHIAEAIASGVSSTLPDAHVTCNRVNEVQPGALPDVDLLIVGAPTHNLNMPSVSSRQNREHRADGEGKTDQLEPHQSGVREWLATLPQMPSTKAATFDTNTGSLISGHASKHIARELKRKQLQIVAKPMSFTVSGIYGPLKTGEAERAKAWGASIAGQI